MPPKFIVHNGKKYFLQKWRKTWDYYEEKFRDEWIDPETPVGEAAEDPLVELTHSTADWDRKCRTVSPKAGSGQGRISRYSYHEGDGND